MATISKCRQVAVVQPRWSNARNITRLGGRADDVNLKIALLTYLTSELNVKFALHCCLDVEGGDPELFASMAVTLKGLARLEARRNVSIGLVLMSKKKIANFNVTF